MEIPILLLEILIVGFVLFSWTSFWIFYCLIPDRSRYEVIPEDVRIKYQDLFVQDGFS